MKIKHLSLLLLLAATAFSAFSQTAKYKFEVGDFSSLKVTDGINVEYCASTDSAGWVFFECDAATAQMLMFINKKNTLTVQLSTDGKPVAFVPTIKVCSMVLHKVENSGDSTVTVSKAVPVRDFSASIIGNGNLIVKDINTTKLSAAIKTGNGHLFVSGSTREADFQNVGTGTIEAFGLTAEDAKCNIVGTGSIDCNASVALSVKGMGSGKVYYGGSPAKIVNRSIGIKAYSADGKQEIN